MNNLDTEGLAERLALLPCPFCGGECDPDGWSSTERTGPACDQCGATADTTNMWNTRPGRWTQKDIDEAKIEAAEMAEYFSRDDSEIKHQISALRSPWRREAERALREARGAFTTIFTGGNHLGTYRTDRWPEPDSDPEHALRMLGATAEYDMWCCWAAMMRTRGIEDTLDFALAALAALASPLKEDKPNV